MTGPDEGKVDEWAHFINVLMLDRHGNRIWRQSTFGKRLNSLRPINPR